MQFMEAVMRSKTVAASLAVTLWLIPISAITSRAADNFKLLYSFPYQGKSGSFPGGPIVLDERGNLYGTTSAGGDLKSCAPQGCGTVFQLAPTSDGWTETVLHSFDWKADGEGPCYNLVLDPRGNLYGVITDGPPGHQGGVFELSPSRNGPWTVKMLHVFHGGTPHSGYVRDTAGNLYGNNYFSDELSELPDGQWSDRAIAQPFSFSTATLKDGNLYDAGGSGTYKYGMVYELTPAKDGKWQELDLYSFRGLDHGFEDGSFPAAGVVFDKKGNIYGATETGGIKSQGCGQYGEQLGCGTIFELSPDGQGGWTESILYRFTDAAHGYSPFSTLNIDSAGNIYGTAVGGTGGGWGVIFKLAPGQNGDWTYSVLHNFTDGKNDGAEPYAPMIFDKQGKHLYGTTAYGGTYNGGIVFELTP